MPFPLAFLKLLFISLRPTAAGKGHQSREVQPRDTRGYFGVTLPGHYSQLMKYSQ